MFVPIRELFESLSLHLDGHSANVLTRSGVLQLYLGTFIIEHRGASSLYLGHTNSATILRSLLQRIHHRHPWRNLWFYRCELCGFSVRSRSTPKVVSNCEEHLIFDHVLVVLLEGLVPDAVHLLLPRRGRANVVFTFAGTGTVPNSSCRKKRLLVAKDGPFHWYKVLMYVIPKEHSVTLSSSIPWRTIGLWTSSLANSTHTETRW